MHYYFPSMDDLFLAVLRDGAETNLVRQREALADDEPLHALWKLNNAHGARLLMEFMALANHRKAIRSEIAGYAERFGDLEESAVTLALRAHGVDMARVPAGGDVDDRDQPRAHPGARTQPRHHPRSRRSPDFHRATTSIASKCPPPRRM